MTDGQGNQVWKTTLPDVKLPVGLEASFNSMISAKDGGYIMVGSKNEQVWLAKFDVQQGGPIPLQLLPYVEALLAIAVVATVLVAAKTRNGTKSQKVKGLKANGAETCL